MDAEFKKNLDEIKSKKKPNLNETRKAVKYLTCALNDNEYEYFAESIMKLKLKICNLFFSEFNLTSEISEKIINALTQCSLFTDNLNNCAISRSFIIISSMLKQNIPSEITIKLAVPLILISQKTNSTLSAAVESFDKYILESGLENDFYAIANCSEDHKSIFDVFSTQIKKSASAEVSTPDNLQGSSSPEVSVTSNADSSSAENHTTNNISDQLEVLRKLSSVEEGISKLAAMCVLIPELKTGYDGYRYAISEKDNKIRSLSEERQVLTESNRNMQHRIDELNEQISVMNEKNTLVEQELKKAFEIDNSNKDQAVATLKENIADALKLEYSQLMEIDDNVDEDNYIAMRSSLVRIFKILKRFGINM